MRAFRVLILLVAAAGGAIGAAAAMPSPVAASCEGILLPFREYAPQSDQVVIGDVVATDPAAPWGDGAGAWSRFTLRVLYSVRGTAPATMRIRDLPFSPCADNIILAAKGDRIALAFGIPSGFDPPEPVATVAWIRGGPAYLEPADRLTVAQVFTLLGRTPPATSTAPLPRGGDGLPILLAGPAVAGLIGSLAVRRRMRAGR